MSVSDWLWALALKSNNLFDIAASAMSVDDRMTTSVLLTDRMPDWTAQIVVL